jgi:hypothetical protein
MTSQASLATLRSRTSSPAVRAILDDAIAGRLSLRELVDRPELNAEFPAPPAPPEPAGRPRNRTARDRADNDDEDFSNATYLVRGY